MANSFVDLLLGQAIQLAKGEIEAKEAANQTRVGQHYRKDRRRLLPRVTVWLPLTIAGSVARAISVAQRFPLTSRSTRQCWLDRDLAA